MRAAIYARVSSATQRERDTIASQLRVLPEYVARQGWTLVETYVDDGATAKTGHLAKRAGLARLLADAAAKRFDVVVVFDIDRLTRSEDLAERGAILGAFQRADVKVASSSTGQILDLRSSMGDLMSALDAFRAADDNRKRGARIAAGKVTAIARGWKPSGPTPYGLHFDRTTRTWSVDPVTSTIVREILERVAAGDSCEQIALDFEARRIPQPRSSVWLKERVWKLATAPHYLGTWIADRARRLEIAVPHVVDTDLYHRAQHALESHNRRGIKRSYTAVYLLQGLTICGHCNSPILTRARTPQRNGRHTPAAYVCRARKLARHDIPVRCDAPIVPVAELDARVWRAVSAELATPALLERLAERDRTAAADLTSWRADVTTANRHLTRLERVERAILTRFRRGEIGDAALDAELAQLRRERQAITEQRSRAQQLGDQVDGGRHRLREAQTLLRELGAAIEVATPEERQRILRVLVRPGGATLQRWGDIEISLLVPTSGSAVRSLQAV
jgi:site-specific DNA recombinase